MTTWHNATDALADTLTIKGLPTDPFISEDVWADYCAQMGFPSERMIEESEANDDYYPYCDWYLYLGETRFDGPFETVEQARSVRDDALHYLTVKYGVSGPARATN